MKINRAMELSISDEEKKYSFSELESMRVKIEKLDKYYQVEVLKILHKYKHIVTLNENKNGVFIQLTDIPSNIIEEIKEYLNYVDKQTKQLQNTENTKDELKNTYF